MNETAKRTENGAKAARLALICAAAIATGSIGYSIARDDTTGVAASGAPTGAPVTEQTAEVVAAIPEIEARLEANPEDEEGWAVLGLAYLDAGRPTDAARAFGEASALDPTSATYFSARGEALILASNGNSFPEDARVAFAAALEIDPSEPRARYFEGVRQDMAGNSQGALEIWTALLRDTPSGAGWELQLRRQIARLSTEQ